MGLGIIIGGITLYRSYALYEEEKEYNVLKGQIPDFGYDVKFAVTVDGQKSNKIPERQKSGDNSYYKVQVSCTNGSTQGEWDYNAWNVKLDDISDGSKCTLAFTGGMSKDEYQRYIEEGVATRRNTYRGKELTLNEAFWTSIKNGTFDDIYVGDYITSKTPDANNRKITWLVADIDNYLKGKDITKHHLTIIPALSLMKAQMNTEQTTEGGYIGSKMYKETLSTVYSQYIEPDFKGHIIEYKNLLTNAIDKEKVNGTAKLGASSNWEWVTGRKLDLMSEINVFGTTIWASSGYDIGVENSQYAIFKLKPQVIYNYKGNYVGTYWLRDVVNSISFTHASETFDAPYYNTTQYDAALMEGVRPSFLIG